MTNNPTNTCVFDSLSFDGEEPPKSSGRSNCTVFLDQPELLNDWKISDPFVSAELEVPAYLRRPKSATRKS